jgi:hypothetical protein
MITPINLDVSKYTAENMESRYLDSELLSLINDWNSKYGHPISKIELDVLNKMECRLGAHKHEDLYIVKVTNQVNLIMPILQELWKKFPFTN